MSRGFNPRRPSFSIRQKALGDIEDTIYAVRGDAGMDYIYLLDKDPRFVAALLREYAANLPED